jgi:glutathione S-transferase
MKLYWSSISPYARKVMIVAHETGLISRIDYVNVALAYGKADPELMRSNPLGKVPTLVLDDGTLLYDSNVICEYLDSLHDGQKFFPAILMNRLVALRRQALGDGLCDILRHWRREQQKTPDCQSQEYFASQHQRTMATLDRMNSEVGDLETTPYNIGHVAFGCAVTHLERRFPEITWRPANQALSAWHDRFAARAASKLTVPVD